MQEHVGTAHKVVEFILTWWQVSLAVVGMVLGSYAWWLHQIFSTKAHTDLCKADMLQALQNQKTDILNDLRDHELRENDKMDLHMKLDAEAHSDLKSDLRWIREHLYRKNGDL